MSNELDEYRKLIVKRRDKLKTMASDLKLSAQSEQDDFKRNTKLWFADLSATMENIYAHIELQAIANYGLKAQIELIKDIVVQLPEVKNNPQIQQDINRLFRQYDSSH
jgi:hypothetical protein